MEFVQDPWMSAPAEHVAARRYNGPLPARLKPVLRHGCPTKARQHHAGDQAQLISRLAGETLHLMGLRRARASCMAAALDIRLEQLSQRLNAYRRDAVRFFHISVRQVPALPDE